MRKLLSKPRAVAGLPLSNIDEDTRLYELSHGGPHLRLVEAEGTGRLQAQEFIAQAYRRVFDAELQSFYPSLIALYGEDGALCGAAGARYAEQQDLFLEQYLSLPVEHLIAEQAGEHIHRNSVVEFGNLSVARPAMTYPFMNMVGGWLLTYGVEWLVFALTRSLRALFQRAGVEMLDLGSAEPIRLAPSPNRWGSYYEHDPRVTAVRLGRGLASFQHHHPRLNVTASSKRDWKPAECRN